MHLMIYAYTQRRIPQGEETTKQMINFLLQSALQYVMLPLLKG